MSAPDVVRHLVEQFGSDIAAYKSRAYNETQVRVDFINPFFAALDWEMAAQPGSRLAYREVVHEDRLRTNLVRPKRLIIVSIWLVSASFLLRRRSHSWTLSWTPNPLCN